MADGKDGFLDKMVTSFTKIQGQDPVVTEDYVAACTNLLPIFDGLGSIFSFPKQDLLDKANSLQDVQSQLTDLKQVLDKDVEAGVATEKGSRARNLHRLIIIQDFVRHIFVNLLADRAKLFRVAVAEAYDVTLGKIHTWPVRTAIKAGLYTLPTTDNFLSSIGETAETGLPKGQQFVQHADAVLERLYKMYDGVTMPGSDVKFLPK